ncbi:hypothetical protein BRYFOR_07702 [Marvinbryantia formatexigens DSM 14469]|uniref:Uncharacterized protein n=1 Tax=Marvinbryantia formatexigens DSM 14469 TaxID=478749 RepID=C6LGE2_9FIRM|nr:hypothetical protein BRYFOR_07702 [Marvinbryantia formatexigens DSM 14469]
MDRTKEIGCKAYGERKIQYFKKFRSRECNIDIVSMSHRRRRLRNKI